MPEWNWSLHSKLVHSTGRGKGLISFPTGCKIGGRGRDWTKPTTVRRFLRCHTWLETKFWRQKVWAACFVKPATHVTINVAINPLADNYLRRLSVLCTHSHQQHVFLGRNTCGFGPSYTRNKSHAMCDTRPDVTVKTIFTRTVHLLEELKFAPKELE